MYKKNLKKIWNGLTTIIVVLIVIMAVLLVGVRLIGFDVFSVLSGSMEPTYHVGSLIYVKDVSADEIQVGDPITFVMNDNLVVATHRVVEIDAENQYFYTKGDANDYVDGSPVHFNNLIGKPVFSIPYLGYFSDFVQNPPGTYIAISAGAIIALLIFLPEILDMFEDEDKDKKQKKDKQCKV